MLEGVVEAVVEAVVDAGIVPTGVAVATPGMTPGVTPGVTPGGVIAVTGGRSVTFGFKLRFLGSLAGPIRPSFHNLILSGSV